MLLEVVWRAWWRQVHLVLLWRWAAGRDGVGLLLLGLLLLLHQRLGRVPTHAEQQRRGRLEQLWMLVWAQVQKVLCAPQ